MEANPLEFRPSELVRLLNSTPAGQVLTESRLFRQRSAAGLRIGSGGKIHLIRYVAWLAERRHAAKSQSNDYETIKERARARAAGLSKSGRDIGAIPEVASPERKAACKDDLRLFATTYFPFTFNLPFSADHLAIIAKIQRAVLYGNVFAMAMPRGSGKTSLCEAAAIWASLYGHRDFTVIIGADKDLGRKILASIKLELEGNDLLLEDFPEAVYPIHALDRIAHRCKGQTYQGEPTYVEWGSDEIALPWIPGASSAGAAIWIDGITGGLRGMKRKLPDGRPRRPNLILLDDPQTRESAMSMIQTRVRRDTIAADILGLAAQDKSMAVLMPCTVIRRGDLADQKLDRSKYPQWQGERFKMIYRWPDRMDLWEEYAERRRAELADDGDGSQATAWYAERREEMDAGAEVDWPEMYDADKELSRIQHAMNRRFADEENAEDAFFSECQNEPLEDEDVEMLKADEIAAKINWLERGVVPTEAVRLVAFIDVQAALLYYVVAAFDDHFSGSVIDYGTYPEQKRSYFALKNARPTLADVTGPGGLESQLYGGLGALCDSILGRSWQREGGGELRIERCVIDANWGLSTPIVKKFCRRSPQAALLLAGHGKYVGAGHAALTERPKKKGERFGLNWIIPIKDGQRYVLYDSNYWKTFAHARLAVPAGEPGSLSLFGDKSALHRLFADHVTAETKARLQRVDKPGGRTADEWRLKPNKPDNHWLDCMTGCCVAASVQGCVLKDVHESLKRSARPGKTMREMREQARARVKESEEEPRERLSMAEMRERARARKAG